jgi:2-amino-4-hydroxy-6-hydroxymethyldihydropteridine diphosphokinase
MNQLYLLTGSNIGNSLGHLAEAEHRISIAIGNIVKVSSIYKTEPWGNKNQQDFFNQVIKVETNLPAEAVLKGILSIENQMGRNRNVKWEPRIIDIDLLFFNNERIQTPILTVPHPLLHERKFTLLPLTEIAPDLIHPVFNLPIKALLARCTDESLVTKIGQTDSR